MTLSLSPKAVTELGRAIAAPRRIWPRVYLELRIYCSVDGVIGGGGGRDSPSFLL